ncbi:MAG TPA: SHOCT domain-containing protein [Burkholderiales bacterium]|nr:SHOCT domain-containing protein [Burkholderiales bacterium]
MSNILSVVCVLLLLAACATANKIAGVRLGMTKDEVVKVMGEPASVSAQGGAEYLNYALSETDDQAFYGFTTPYFVRLINGKVESYGRSGDFDSTKTPTVRIESDQTIKQNVEVTGSADLYTELKKLKELNDSGIITDAEFESQKKKLLDKH